jgi:hypothetical protein
MSFFRRTTGHELEAATLAALLSACGLIKLARLPGPRIEDVERFCDVYEAFRGICPATRISFDHAWYLGQTLAHGDEYVLARCPLCLAVWIRDRLDLLPDNCANCRSQGATCQEAPRGDC